ncbi:hypothetical protein [Hymenobacter chitinivorans]|uniref:Uncharacterized protein n=1 Tax=Hymenobacter chitinivorans DSM 11115 TaxID=1121954 RepID=A0A2M9B5Q7_9BACT|nr:hypothetical protein [Hymenobacter chitinivorans]PJJ53272.1 hypothetical protein CLV45_3932 [Hymenobacter chitinivorans DSM 11115]
MKKNKKTKAKAPKKKSLLSGAAKSLKKLSRGSVGKLTTTQKVVGGTALVALGLGYLAQRRNAASASAAATTDTDANTGETLSGTEGASI